MRHDFTVLACVHPSGQWTLVSQVAPSYAELSYVEPDRWTWSRAVASKFPTELRCSASTKSFHSMNLPNVALFGQQPRWLATDRGASPSLRWGSALVNLLGFERGRTSGETKRSYCRGAHELKEVKHFLISSNLHPNCQAVSPWNLYLHCEWHQWHISGIFGTNFTCDFVSGSWGRGPLDDWEGRPLPMFLQV